jgi:cell wall-associated NlpC family hydrolase
MRPSTLAVLALLAALGTGCASTGAVPRPFPMPGVARATPPTPALPSTAPGTLPSPSEPAASSDSTRDPDYFRAIIETALDFRGVPYRNGGGDPKGFDCSGFTQYVFAQHGVALPREVRDQFLLGAPIDPSADLLAGDLLFFTTTEPGASHVAISLGGDEFVHAPSSKGVVRVERLTTEYWNERFLGARRLTLP